jgi:hypothetical protein
MWRMHTPIAIGANSRYFAGLDAVQSEQGRLHRPAGHAEQAGI